MSCLVTAGIKIPCKKTKGGIKRLLVADEGVLIPTFTGSVITAFGGTTPTVIEFLFDAGQGGANSTGTNTREGSPFFTETVTANFFVIGSLKADQLLAMNAGRKQFIVEDFAGNYKLYGLTSGMLVTLIENLGTAAGDMTGYELSATAEESTLPPICTDAIGDLTITAATL